MKILIVCATNREVKQLRDKLNFIQQIDPNYKSYRYFNLSIDILVTGTGSTFLTYFLTKAFNVISYDLAINVGIAGSFDFFLEHGFVVNVIQEQFADLGIEDKKKFFTIFEKELMDESSFPFTLGGLKNLGNFEIEEVETLIPVKAITVNSMPGNADTIEKLKTKYNPDIITFEGAAFFYTCLMEKIPFLQIRTISNFVEIRKVENWGTQKALRNLSKAVMDIFDELKID